MSAFQPVDPNGNDPKPEKPIDSLRGRLRDAAEKIPQLDALIQIVADACEPTLKVRMQGHKCPKGICNDCPHVYFAEIPNGRNAMEALKFVMEQVEGKPGTAEAGGQGVSIRYIVVGVDE